MLLKGLRPVCTIPLPLPHPFGDGLRGPVLGHVLLPVEEAGNGNEQEGRKSGKPHQGPDDYRQILGIKKR